MAMHPLSLFAPWDRCLAVKKSSSVQSHVRYLGTMAIRVAYTGQKSHLYLTTALWRYGMEPQRG
jgi:hypothetical protein